MYKCSKCNGLYKESKENSKLICQSNPVEHIIKCPHCGDENHVIGADVDTCDYGSKEKPAYIMYGRDRKPTDVLQIIEGIAYTELNKK